MVMWEQASDAWSREQWDRTLCEAHDRSVFQSYGWGEYKRASGWAPIRWVARDPGEEPIAAVQFLVKPVLSGVMVAWAPGGPVTRFPRSSEHDLDDVLASMREQCGTGGGVSYGRICSYQAGSEVLAHTFGRTFRRPLCRLTSGHTIRLDLTQTLERLMGRMRAKHRYYVKQSLTERIHWVAGNDPALVQELGRLYAEMAGDKGLNLLPSSDDDLLRLCDALREHALIVAGFVEGRAVTACLVLTFGGKAFYWRAATGRAGRELSASYAMIYQLLEHLQKLGVAELDFGGIVPRSAAMAGINHFKQGFGGEPVQYLGEWEWARSWWLRWGVNLAIRRRRDQL